ncbi:MAG: extracellular solute-binding protein [Candidatus Omnitrophica bacterium]|nr:extracellular solute-binding protein [Candidatus Omnitrophota bacterium]
MKFLKLKSLVLLALFVASIPLVFMSLSGCTSKKSKQDKIIIWHWMTDRKDALDSLAEQYFTQTGVRVEFKLFFPPDVYASKVIAAGRAKNLPDIFGILGEKKTFASFIKAGHILNLTPYMTENLGAWQNRFYEPTLAVTTFKEKNNYSVPSGVYGVPVDTTMMQFVYNRDILTKAGLDPEAAPVTFEDFFSQAKKIKEILGIDAFVCGWGETWLLNALATEWAINLMGEEKFQRTINGEVAYTDQAWITVFSLFARLRDSGFLPTNIVTMTNKEAEDAFSKGKAAFSFNGSWSVNVYKQKNPDLNYSFFPIPKVSGIYPAKIWGGAGSSFMVNANTAYKDKAIAFLKWLTSKEQQQFLIRETNNFPSIKECEETLPPILKTLKPNLEVLTHPDVWDKNEDSRVLEVMNRGLQQILLGIKNPQDVAEEIQKVKERISKR